MVEPGAIPQGSLGAWLRQQREARGVSLRDIADSSKISLRYLEALERDRLDVLPAPVFAKGFLREYARVVGLDADEAINLYLLALSVRDARLSEQSAPEPTRERRSAAPSTLGYGLLLTLAVVLFLGVAALLSFYAGRRRDARPLAPSPEALATFVAPSPTEPPEPTAVPPTSVATPVTPGAAAAASTGPLKVTLDFSEDCWVEFVIDGRRRTSELRAGGESLELEAEQSVLLTLGNARGVRVEVDGRPFTLPTNAARVVRDLRIERAAANDAPVATTG